MASDETDLTAEAAKKTTTTAATTTTTTGPITSLVTITLKTASAWINPSIIKLTGGIGIKVKGSISNSTIGPVEIVGAKQSIYFDPAAIVRNLTITALKVTDAIREGIRIQGDVDTVTIKDFSLKQRAVPTEAPDLPSGIAIYTGKNITISDGYVSGFQMNNPGKYPNGDGISSEREVDNLMISRVTSSDNSDGGFDLKSTNTFLYDLKAERNYRSYRLWGSANAGTLTSVDPKNAHVYAGNGAVVVIDKLIARSTTTALLVYAEDAKSVTIKSCDLQMPAGTKLVYKSSPTTVINLGPGCAL